MREKKKIPLSRNPEQLGEFLDWQDHGKRFSAVADKGIVLNLIGLVIGLSGLIYMIVHKLSL